MLMAQLDSVLVRFNAFVDDGNIRLAWTIKGGFQCGGTIIQHSGDSINFENIGSIPGICGSPFYDESYSFDDLHPVLNSVNYYRIDMIGLGISKIISQDLFDFSENQVLIIPNPIVSEGQIVFENIAAETCNIKYFHSSGKTVYSENTRGNKFKIQAAKFPAGIIFFQILKSEEFFVSGKILIL
ncbi:MAG: hypothetical protein U9R19_13115, partial [Bacteroidota bacterium]|nr:hypothetical protein [Bacteroidota bacterium]